LAIDLYKKKIISERHRHRYEVNPEFLPKLSTAGFNVSGENPETHLVEVMELDRNLHPYFIGTQAHPEFKSRLTAPAPLFAGLITAAIQYNKNLIAAMQHNKMD
jgi:CTP synthase